MEMEGVNSMGHGVKDKPINKGKIEVKSIDNAIEKLQELGLMGNRVIESLGVVIKRHREELNMSLKDVEQLSGISSSYIHRLEKGERKSPGLQIIFKLASALQVPYDKLISEAYDRMNMVGQNH